MHHPTDSLAHTTAFVTPVVEHWLNMEYIRRAKPEWRRGLLACLFVCMYVCRYVFMCVRVCAHMCVHACVCVCVQCEN